MTYRATGSPGRDAAGGPVPDTGSSADRAVPVATASETVRRAERAGPAATPGRALSGYERTVAQAAPAAEQSRSSARFSGGVEPLLAYAESWLRGRDVEAPSVRVGIGAVGEPRPVIVGS